MSAVVFALAGQRRSPSPALVLPFVARNRIPAGRDARAAMRPDYFE